MTKRVKSGSRLEFKSIEEFRKHYYPKGIGESEEQRDVCAIAEHHAMRTIKAMRKQMAKKKS